MVIVAAKTSPFIYIMSKHEPTMFSYLILFKKNMLDVNDDATKHWLRELTISGRMISIDGLVESINPVNEKNSSDNFRGFAVINAQSNLEINSILQKCAAFDADSVQIYKLSI